ncbi:MAG: hypothetical protein JST85_02795 [Acidobacteria bacterium]|nr:hypothetical protein [Acidobacteriota bacterium]
MKPTIRLIEDEDYPADDIAPEYDFAELQQRAQAEGREYRGLLSGKLVRLAPDVAEAYPTAEAVNEALRKLMREGREAA